MPEQTPSVPVQHSADNLGLKLNVLEWPAQTGDAPVLLLHHGFLDIARSWQRFADVVAGRWRLLAVDARGHGDSDWVGAGGYYHFQDYVMDLDAVHSSLAPGTQLVLVGHSMGGMACGYYAGTWPERVTAYVSIEGLGPPDTRFADAPQRVRDWVDGVRRLQSRSPRLLDSVQHAARRLQDWNPRLDPEFATFLAEHGTRPVDGGVAWKYDPLHRTRSPQLFHLSHARAFWERIDCPVLYIDGAESQFRYPEAEARASGLAQEIETIDGAGHMIHHEQPAALSGAIERFLKDTPRG